MEEIINYLDNAINKVESSDCNVNEKLSIIKKSKQYYKQGIIKLNNYENVIKKIKSSIEISSIEDSINFIESSIEKLSDMNLDESINLYKDIIHNINGIEQFIKNEENNIKIIDDDLNEEDYGD